jgi:general secretion pathway protein G
MAQRGSNRFRAFSLIELVIVVVIIAIISAIAIPRISRGAEAANEAALIDNLRTVRRAIDFYHVEHNAYPALATLSDQLTQYTDANGNVSNDYSSSYCFGPYIKVMPRVTVGGYAGRWKIAAGNGPAIGWIYNEVTGEFSTTAPETDSSGRTYSSY